MVLPPCPLRLKTSFVWKHQLGGFVLLLLGVGAAVGYAWWQSGTVRALVDQTRTWAAGVEALGASVHGKESTNHGFFHTYTLTVQYVDRAGAMHEHEIEFDTLGGEVDSNRPVAVHYLSAEPERFALSWAQDVRTSRWVAIVFLAVVGVGLVGGSFAWIGYATLRRLGDARRCAAHSDEYLARVTRVEPQMVKGRQRGNTFHYTAQTADGRPIAGKVLFPLPHGPLFADSAREHLVVLVAQGHLQRPVVPRDDFHPFALTADEQATARAALGLGPAAG